MFAESVEKIQPTFKKKLHENYEKDSLKHKKLNIL